MRGRYRQCAPDAGLLGRAQVVVQLAHRLRGPCDVLSGLRARLKIGQRGNTPLLLSDIYRV